MTQTTPTLKTFAEEALGRDIQAMAVRKTGRRDKALIRHEYGYGSQLSGKWRIWRTYPTIAAGMMKEHGNYPDVVRHVTERWEKLMGATSQWWEKTGETHTAWTDWRVHECQYGCVGANLAADRR